MEARFSGGWMAGERGGILNSLILSSTGLEQSMVKTVGFFLPLVATLAGIFQKLLLLGGKGGGLLGSLWGA